MLPPLPSLSPWKDGQLNGMVQKTFIHAQSPATTTLLSSLRRSSSVGDLSETTRSTSARPASCDSKDSNHDFVDSLRNQDKTLVKDVIPPTPTFLVPQTPLTPLGFGTSVYSFSPPSALPVLHLSDLLA